MLQTSSFIRCAIPALITVAVVWSAGGCASRSASSVGPYETVGKDPRRDADLAKAENRRGVDLLEQGKMDEAEAAFKAALSADLMCGPAHNNIGKVYYRQNKLYLAAWEFQYAMKLMPNQPEPLNNLGLVFEAAGRLSEATDSYTKAVSLEPDNIHAMGNLARACVRRGDKGPDLVDLLGQLALRETRPDWLAWERSTLARLQARPATD